MIDPLVASSRIAASGMRRRHRERRLVEHILERGQIPRTIAWRIHIRDVSGNDGLARRQMLQLSRSKIEQKDRVHHLAAFWSVREDRWRSGAIRNHVYPDAFETGSAIGCRDVLECGLPDQSCPKLAAGCRRRRSSSCLDRRFVDMTVPRASGGSGERPPACHASWASGLDRIDCDPA